MQRLLFCLMLLPLLAQQNLVEAADDPEIGCLRGDCINGYGILVQETEEGLTHYRGEFRDGQYHGDGRLEYLDLERVYKGDWLVGMRHGRGTLSERSVNWSPVNRIYDVYISNWRNDRRHGQGTQAFNIENWREDRNTENWLVRNTENYTGDFVRGVFSGEGTYRWDDGTKYTGGWAANKKHGRGYFDFGTGIRSERIFEYDVQVDF